MRKKLSLLALLVLIATGSAHAFDFSAVTSSGHTLCYNIVSGGVEVTYPGSTSNPWSYYIQPTGTLVIDSTVIYEGTTYNVTSIGNSAFSGCSGLTSVTISNSVTSIGNSAFSGCSGLTSVTISNSVTSIGYDAFYYCTGLTSVTIPNSVTSIGYRAFWGCSGLTSVTISNSVTSIGYDAFCYCTGLTTVHYTGSVVDWCGITFSSEYSNPLYYAHHLWIDNVEVTSVVIPGSIAEIKPYLFSGCYRLTSVTLEEGIVDIGGQAFKDCGIIGELVIPQSVTTIGSEGFRNCYGINEITCLGRVAPSLGSDSFLGIDTSITVNIPCGTTNLYAGRWAYFHNFNEIPFLFNVASDNLAYGTVQMLQEPSCDDPVAIVKATARTGYHFDHWSDGSTQNPYTCVVTGSMTLTAFFASDHGQTGIEDADGEADGPRVYADGREIVVTGVEGEEVCLYDMMGRLLATRQGEDVHGGTPLRFDVPASGVYLVRIGDRAARKVVVVR